MSAEDDAVFYFYENVALLLPSYWGLGSLEFVDVDQRAAFFYFYENVT